jgi:cytidine deaminase
VVDKAELIRRAIAVRNNAYAPYSGYLVGSAVQSGSGAIFQGVNFENRSYGGTICAERGAIAALVASGETQIAEIAVATLDQGTPCGMCLQVIAEFADADCLIHCTDPNGDARTYTLQELLPHVFKSDNVSKV